MNKEFRIGDLFDIHPTKAYKLKNYDLFATQGVTPVLSNSSSDNGIGGYCGLEPTEEGKIITFSDTTTGADTMFYQAKPFIGYPHVQGMYPHNYEVWNEKRYLYVISSIRKASGTGWSYAVKFNRALVRELMVELPVIENSDPNHEYTVDDIDWQYMEDRIKELEEDRIKELEAYLKVTNLDDYELTDEDKKVLSLSRKSARNENGSLETNCENGTLRYKKFIASDLFDIKKGKRLTKANMMVGIINFVGSSSINNGITAKIGNTECIHSANTISVSYNGSVGEVFLQEEPFWASDDVNVWYPKFTFNTRVIEYIMSVIKKCRKKYSYSAKWTLDKMKNEDLELPVTADGNPDFDYMERYIRAIEKLTIADVVKYKDKVISTTKKLVNSQS